MVNYSELLMLPRLLPVLFLAQIVPPAPVSGQDKFDDVQFEATHVAGRVYMLGGSSGNIGVSVGADGILIIDDQIAPLAEKIRAAVKSLSDGKIKFVLNTHWHGDHTGGNVKFGADAPIIAHENVRKRLSVTQSVRGRTVEALPPGGLPVITFADSLSIHFNGEELRVIHTPHSHTDGDSVILFSESNVAHLGDLFFSGRFPFVDLQSGGSIDGLTTSIQLMIEQLQPDVKIIPGHGPISTLDDLKAYHKMLVETSRIVQAQMGKGRSVEDIKKKGFPAIYEEWGSGFISTDFWIETLFESLSGSSIAPE